MPGGEKIESEVADNELYSEEAVNKEIKERIKND